MTVFSDVLNKLLWENGVMVQRQACFLIIWVVLVCACPALSETNEINGINAELIPIFGPDSRLADHFSCFLKIVNSIGHIQVSESTLNPGNQFLMIPDDLASSEFRPNLSLELENIYLGIKPRATITWKQWKETGTDAQSESSGEIFINEWLARCALWDNIILSYGRENLQWGPSYLLSPSNQFMKNNGQSNPKKEVPGSDFAKAIWVMDPSLTLSVIANTAEGEQSAAIDSVSTSMPDLQFPRYPKLYEIAGVDADSISNQVIESLGFPYEFNRSYAIKADYSTFEKYFSIIGSYKEKDRSKLGFFGGMTVSDAMLLYLEGSFSQGTDTLYPVKKCLSPFGSVMLQTEDDTTALEGLLLVGGSYTLDYGQTFVLEGVYNSAGYNDEQADLYFELRKKASDAYDAASPLSDLARLALFQALDPRLRLLRKHYVMLQYQQMQIFNQFNVILRYTLNLDDYSSQLNPIIEYDFTDNIQIFAVGQQNFGNRESEFRSFADYGITIGFEYIF